ncbi:MAG: hypothetical protein ACI8Q1_003153 [Parvicella sp.]|jgi:hypothetical protein
MVIKRTKDGIEYVNEAPGSGIWKMFDIMDTHRRAVASEKEAFFLRIARKGDYLYEGADM